MERRLAAILAADVVGFSRLIRSDEEGTIAALKAIRDELIDPMISSHSGRIVKLMGDGILAEFPSAVEAVRCAVEIQSGIAGRNQFGPDHPIKYRIGINTGDVVVEDDDLYGDAVNLAARMEPMAKPGGVCVSRNVYDQVKRKLPIDFEDLGIHTFKNIDEPIKVFSISPTGAGSAPEATSETPSKKGAGVRLASALIAVLAVISGIVLWIQPWQAREEVADVANMALPLPEKPSIAVLPFSNLSGDKEQEYFADGITADLITDLSKVSGLFVIARNSTFPYKGQLVKIRQVAEDLGVRYVLEGSVRRAGKQLRINVQLVDATTGGHLWAERYDGTVDGVFGLQDRVTAKIVNAMSVRLTPVEEEDLRSLGTTNVEAHDAYLRGLSFYLKATPRDNAKARDYFERALEFDPDFKRANTALAKVYFKAINVEYEKALEGGWRQAIFTAHVHLAKSAGANLADAHIVRSWMALNKHQVNIAAAEAERAIALRPNDADALKARAKALIFLGQYSEGQKIANRALRLDPAVPAEPLYLIGLSQFALGNYEESAKSVVQALEHDPATSSYAAVLASAYGKLGRGNEARAAFQVYKKSWIIEPTIQWVVFAHPYQDRQVLEHFADGLANAGFLGRGKADILHLSPTTKLSGAEIKSLLFGHTIKGAEFWRGIPWTQKRSADGIVEHAGVPIHTGNSKDKIGRSWIENDRLCDSWTKEDNEMGLCVLIFRDKIGKENFRMVTDYGPHRFWQAK